MAVRTILKRKQPQARDEPEPELHATPQPNSLALLALLTSAVVVTTRGNEFFNIWDSMVGLIIVTVASTYRNEVGVERAYRAAFSLIVGAGLMLMAGPFVESVLYYVYPSLEYDGPLLHSPGKMIYDGVFVGIWAVFAIVVYARLARRQEG